MTDPQNISIQEYTYSLPQGRIADYPLPERDASKLLVYQEGEISQDLYRNMAHHLPGHTLLVFNNTKVVEARLLFQKSAGGHIELFCLEPHEQYADITTAMLQTGSVQWKCLVGGASKWKTGQLLEKHIRQGVHEITLVARCMEKRNDSFIIELSWSPASLSFAELLHAAGAVPLPPYIKRTAEEQDQHRYQTIYARWDGSVAAPTAGLHFTGHIFQQLEKKNIPAAFVTLHVGAGTFRPVKSETMQTHEMHAEWMEVSRATIQHLIEHLDQRIVAVGTTSLRTLESLYWLGLKLPGTAQADIALLQQWEAYELAAKNIPPKVSLQALVQWMDENKLENLAAKTQLLIVPGYDFKIVTGLVTNFHQPQSTLLLLVAAFIGEDWRKVYQYALQHDFRFLSYGDGSLLWRRQSGLFQR